jgi:small neutral amino acid transporter SnatA (MarC family)
MSGWFALLVLLAAINPPRVRPHLDVPTRPAQTLAAVIIVLVVGSVLVVVAIGFLDALQITSETWHIGAGAVGLLVGARVVVAPGIAGIEVPDGWAAAAAPYAFPLLLTPQLAVLMVLLGATGSKAAAVGWLAAVLAITVGVCSVPYRRPGLWSAAARFLGAMLVIMSVALVIAGIRDV